MIFDCEYVTGLVRKWQATRDKQLLELILEQSQHLIEAIVSGYDSFYREDLIQESSLRVQYALPFFDQTKANLHTYLTTVINNICKTYTTRQYRYNAEFPIEPLESYIGARQEDDSAINDMLVDLISHNRERFPSLPIEIIDEISEHICYSLHEDNGKRYTISNIVSVLGIDRSIADIVYTSSVIYLRYKHMNDVVIQKDTNEFSIHKDLKLIFGDKMGEYISIIFTGMSIKFP